MDVFIFCAGLGTRLLPFTKTTPKPLMPLFNGRICLDVILERVRAINPGRIFINVHHLADKIIEHVQKDPRVMLSYEETLLDTGGALKKMRPYLRDRLLVINGDIFWDNENLLQWFIERADPTWPLCLGLIEKHNDFNHFEQPDYILQPGHRAHYQNFGQGLKYSGIHIIEPKLLDAFSDDVFSVKKVFDMCEHHHNLFGLVLPTKWQDIGLKLKRN